MDNIDLLHEIMRELDVELKDISSNLPGSRVALQSVRAALLRVSIKLMGDKVRNETNKK